MAVPVLGILFARGAKTEIIGAPEEIPVDAWITRGHVFSSSVTNAPVEDGTNVNDHVIQDAPELTIEGFTSDHPVNLLATPAAVIGAAEEFLGLSGGETRSQAAAKALFRAWKTKAALEVVTRLHTYKNMQISVLEWNEDRSTANALAFRLRMTKITTVALQRVPSSGLTTAAADLASGPVEAGRQAPKATPRPTPAAVTSLSQAAGMAG